ncbi:hypothetical protein [Streptomyces sp. MZ04]|uniref:hypothetical protein n=1 Tax=Streptomyces sp. MZ04 TaxID=2559236 RepID=UPI00107E9D00|nr:hypothetical protein [Streptomyces sp. MZ04]TGA97448.1 hypothetical protein E2651_31390 [Streptomyces sp. MZ04]
MNRISVAVSHNSDFKTVASRCALPMVADKRSSVHIAESNLAAGFVFDARALNVYLGFAILECAQTATAAPTMTPVQQSGPDGDSPR